MAASKSDHPRRGRSAAASSAFKPVNVDIAPAALDELGQSREVIRSLQEQIFHLKNQLHATQEEYRAANHAKDEFLAMLSHEIRTPLGAILLWAKLLDPEKPISPENLREGLSAIRTSAEAQKELIEDLLDMSRITMKHLRLNLREVELLPVVRDALTLIKPAADTKGVTVSAHLSHEAGVVRIDPDRMRQIVWNLLSNAVKFTPARGKVEVCVRRRGDEIDIGVKDTGKGITAEFLPHIFERFRQADTTHDRANGGIGLGLAITRELVQMHGGTIAGHSDGPGRGAIFAVRMSLPDLSRT
ncbi:MAG TPA: HAMP domain-containing sensor histidine kinase, partial [Tepidisphaeraceae bacterium]|nr:HAMP domain-containing sensor histidine kinase [Tepidisphaeraceae bacterium]